MLAGGRLCGAVRYRTDEAPFNETICHCRSCRLAAGAAAVAWFTVPTPSLRFVAGKPSHYRSSAQATRGFCGSCGTALTYQHDDLLGEIDLTIATLDEPETLAPRDHTQAGEALAWNKPADGLPVYPGPRDA